MASWFVVDCYGSGLVAGFCFGLGLCFYGLYLCLLFCFGLWGGGGVVAEAGFRCCDGYYCIAAVGRFCFCLWVLLLVGGWLANWFWLLFCDLSVGGLRFSFVELFVVCGVCCVVGVLGD